MKYDSIGFDLDGTLWDVLDTITLAWDETADRHKLKKPSKDDMAGVLGLNKIDLMNKLFPDMEAKAQLAFFDEAIRVCIRLIAERGGNLFDKLEETLSELSKNYKLYIVSNCEDGYIEAFFSYHKLQKYFCDYEHPDARCLPKSENIKLVLERNGFKNSVYVGDTQGDADAAKSAGIPFIFASYGFGSVEAPDYTIEKFEDILETVQ